MAWFDAPNMDGGEITDLSSWLATIQSTNAYLL